MRRSLGINPYEKLLVIQSTDFRRRVNSDPIVIEFVYNCRQKLYDSKGSLDQITTFRDGTQF